MPKQLGTYYHPNQGVPLQNQTCVILYQGNTFSSREALADYLVDKGFTDAAASAIVNRVTMVQLTKESMTQSLKSLGHKSQKVTAILRDPRKKQVKRKKKDGV